ncbi:ribonuclease E inhibitor RraA/Dimethylmenaquinone methyltransferase [Neohortaea acidophila]|uniref:Ribonuclease E inhibitor RraA/Dimethylmenaquinone methyltransferase n=1 Tax=Neohortaea acidophila TaxID=245834 RepID=A0A6A6PJ90_9PEZI|nr:ribonuclease E inhibitor RraA/Dimethylmenaquinone methyltransferase [Neohortaea acidophila]KAF2480099.1 ribonuclease E inhibitor RraA/Dimethylmenaquinone methyltransferase [Neohortaea acidophila]
MNTKAIVKRLEAFTSCDVADALLKLKVPHGGFLAGLTMWSPQRQEGPTRIVGPAYTVKYVRKNYENEPKPAGHYIDSVPSGSVVFISAPPRMINACYGGLMSNRAKYLGAVGTVIDGRLRDLQEHRDLHYPVFARDVGTTAPQEVARVSEVNAPVRLNSEEQDAVINPGDILIGDINGVVCLPQGLAEKALDLMQSQVDADVKVAADINKGRTAAEAMKEHRANVKQP